MRLLCALVFAFAAGCGGAATSSSKSPSAASSNAAAEPAKKFDFNAEMKKEAANLHPFPINAPDGSFSAMVSAVTSPKVTPSEKDSFTVAVDVAAKSPLDCAVFHRRVDTASTMWNLAVAPVEKFPQREVLTLDIAMDDDRPVVTLNMAALNEQKAAYVVKATLVALPDWTVVCRHDEIGYAATTKAVTTELARTLKPAKPSRVARYHDVAILRVEGRLAGFLERFVHDNDAGDRTLETEFGVALLGSPTGDGDVFAEDDIGLTEIDNEGLVRSATRATGSAQGGLTKKLTLTRTKGSEYEVEGEARGKPIKATLKSKKPLVGMALLAQAVATNARAPKGAPFALETWSPGSAPTAITTSTYTRGTPFDANAPVFAVKSDDDTMTIAHDEKGVSTHLTSKTKNVAIEISRVLARGNLTTKR